MTRTLLFYFCPKFEAKDKMLWTWEFNGQYCVASFVIVINLHMVSQKRKKVIDIIVVRTMHQV
ncbi:unnamed protein product [Camellia sinensis]